MTHASEKKILVVDDEPDVRNFLVACIEDAGFQVETAVDGVEALEKIAADPPDLMTLDMIMPRKSGIQVIRTLRENKEMAHLPVILITAHAHDEFGSEDFKNFNAFVSGMRPRYTMEKPVTPAKLVKAISDILKVDIDDADTASPSSEREKVMQLIKDSDEETLAKIKDMLGKAS